jgi:hypothetical protein
MTVCKGPGRTTLLAVIFPRQGLFSFKPTVHRNMRTNEIAEAVIHAMNR